MTRISAAEEAEARLKRLTNELPSHSELHRLLSNIEDPANDEASKDRYVALAAASILEEGLKVAIIRRWATLGEPKEKRIPLMLGPRINLARDLGIVSPEQHRELTWINAVRKAFAHAVTPVSFGSPDIETLTRHLFCHPVNSWAGYFAPIFNARRQFAIVCGEFYSFLTK